MTRELGEERFVPRTDLRVLEGDRRSVERFCRAHEETRRQWRRCASYLDNGYHALLAERGGEIVGFVWWHDHRVEPKRRHPHLTRYGLTLEPGQVWGFDLYLLEQHRGKGTSNDFFASFRVMLRDRGYTRVFGHVDARNLPAVWLHKLQGYKPVKTVDGRLWGKVLLWSGGRLLLRNPPFVVRQRFDFRPLW
jgi:GNAT superfamily N-acetyltransferase